MQRGNRFQIEFLHGRKPCKNAERTQILRPLLLVAAWEQEFAHTIPKMKARKFFQRILSAIPYFLIAAVLLAVIFFPRPKKEPTQTRVVSVWNVDTFEGGKGSRTAFLKKIARKVEKQRAGVYFLVTNYTIEGAEAAAAQGNAPDLLSFGVGLSVFAEQSFALPYDFAGGSLGGECRAVPWCRGGYFLFSLTDDFDSKGTVALSDGGKNLPEAAAAYAQVRGEKVESQAAYTGFLNGTYRYLLGTQRDVCRFQARGATVYRKPLPLYNDLFQYISVLSNAHREDAFAFLDVLLSAETAALLGEIGMEPVEERSSGAHTVNVFTDAEALLKIAESARSGETKNLDKFLKTI